MSHIINLGLLFEKEGDFHSANKLFEKALELDPEDEVISQNSKRVVKKIKEEERSIEIWKKEQNEALKSIKNENVYIHERISYLIDAENNEGYIVASYKQMPTILKTSPEKSQELTKNFLKKHYLSKINDHDIDTLSNVYRLSSAVKEYILKRNQRIVDNEVYSTIGERINIDSFEALGYNSDLLMNVDSKISNSQLKRILKRDLKENVFALLTESFKTALVISGSIIESFILSKVDNSGIHTHLPSQTAKKKKKIINMNLSELLFVADSNDIIDIQLYHFSQALKQYRNFVHPAVEIRKGKVKKISERDAKLAWEVTKKIIYEL